MANDSQYTPKWIFDRMGIEFDLDVAAPISDKTHVPARKRYTELDDGLAQLWQGFVWMNPPYSDITPWVDKFINHGYGIALVQVSKSIWFNRLWEIADSIIILPHSLKFEQPDGKMLPIYMPTILAGLGDETPEILSKIGARVR